MASEVVTLCRILATALPCPIGFSWAMRMGESAMEMSAGRIGAGSVVHMTGGRFFKMRCRG